MGWNYLSIPKLQRCNHVSKRGPTCKHGYAEYIYVYINIYICICKYICIYIIKLCGVVFFGTNIYYMLLMYSEYEIFRQLNFIFSFGWVLHAFTRFPIRKNHYNNLLHCHHICRFWKFVILNPCVRFIFWHFVDFRLWRNWKYIPFQSQSHPT